MRDYRRVTDLASLPDEVVAMYDDGTAGGGEAVYAPPPSPGSADRDIAQ